MKRNIFILAVLVCFFAGNVYAQNQEEYMMSIIKNEVIGKKSYNGLLKQAFDEEKFILDISDKFAETVGIKKEGFKFKKLMNDDEYYYVMYSKRSKIKGVEKKDDILIVNEQNRCIFYIVINRKDFKFESAFYM